MPYGVANRNFGVQLHAAISHNSIEGFCVVLLIQQDLNELIAPYYDIQHFTVKMKCGYHTIGVIAI